MINRSSYTADIDDNCCYNYNGSINVRDQYEWCHQRRWLLIIILFLSLMMMLMHHDCSLNNWYTVNKYGVPIIYFINFIINDWCILPSRVYSCQKLIEGLWVKNSVLKDIHLKRWKDKYTFPEKQWIINVQFSYAVK